MRAMADRDVFAEVVKEVEVLALRSRDAAVGGSGLLSAEDGAFSKVRDSSSTRTDLRRAERDKSELSVF